MSNLLEESTPAKSEAKNQLRKPRIIMACALALSFALAALLAHTASQFSQATDRAQQEYTVAHGLSAEIVYQDEVLTMSAKLAVSTGEALWLDRYDSSAVALDDALTQTRLLGETGLFRLGGLAQMDRANPGLLDLETQALTLVREGRNREGLALLETNQYLTAKASYSEGMDTLVNDMHRGIQIAKTNDRGIATSALGIAAAAGLVTVALCVLAWRSLSVWRQRRMADLIQSHLADQDQRSALVEMQDQLDTLAENSGLDWWQIDAEGNLMSAKGQIIDPESGHRGLEAATNVFGLMDEFPEFLSGVRRALNGEVVNERFIFGDEAKQSLMLPDVSNGEVKRVMGISNDISAEWRLQRELQHQAKHDSLTGLLNRSGFEKEVNALLSDAETTGTMLLLDISGLRALNDLRGHEVGDRALAAVAARIAKLAEPSGLAARIGGDEFCVFVSGLSHQQSDTLAEELAQCVVNPISDPTGPVALQAAVGYDGPVLHARTFRSELPALDVSLGHARRTRSNVGRFLPSMISDFAEEMARIDELADAIENREIHVAFQPIWDAATGQIAGAEALARWSHPERGPISPGEFIPRAENAGLIRDLDRLVLELACEQLALWQQSDPALHHTRLSINLSADDLADDGLTDRVATLCHLNGLAPSNLLFELTESSAVENLHVAQERLEELRGLGCRLALDDFGTGYSSLGHLQNLAVDVLKIDRSFVSGDSANRRELCEMIVGLAKLLNLGVVAEGVETPDQLDDIRRLGCDYVQGYLLAKPLPAIEFAELVIDLNKGTHQAFHQLEQHSAN